MVPLYEFYCGTCKQRFAACIRAVSDFSAVSCPKCHSTHVLRLLSFNSVSNKTDEITPQISHNKSAEADWREIIRWSLAFAPEKGDRWGNDFQSEMDEALEVERLKQSDTEKDLE
jgi:putative FmdB family regulatory protein